MLQINNETYGFETLCEELMTVFVCVMFISSIVRTLPKKSVTKTYANQETVLAPY